MRRILSVLALVMVWAAPASAAEDERILGNPSAVEACTKCHDQPAVTSILHTKHMARSDDRTRAATEGCQSCHGDSSAHVARVPSGGQRPPPSVVFSGPRLSPVGLRNETCNGCHRGGDTMHWQGSTHETSDVACTSCHKSHTLEDAVLTKATQPPVCFTCHAERRADALKPSHHPILEGKVACGDCHNPHGGDGPTLLRTNTVNDTCLSCHDEKRGPFLWEHAPVQEQCTICHTPHGSVQATLLKQRAPFLCQNCHDSSLHESQPFSGANLPNGALPSRQMVLRGCLNCHSEIHGSNHPSGVRFSR